MLINNNIPVVLFDRYFDDLDTNYVVIDNENSTHHGTQHLLSRGYRNIGFITIDVDQIQMKGRLDGYLNAITENKLKSYVLKIPYSETGSKNGKNRYNNSCRRIQTWMLCFSRPTILRRSGWKF